MRRATKWLAFLLIMTMLSTFILASAVTALAADEEPAVTGRIEMVVWSDLNGNGKFDIPTDMFGEEEDEGIDGIKVVLSKWEWIESDSGGAYGWVPKSTKVTGPGSLLNDPATDYKHGCVTWENLAIDDRYGTTSYKLDLVVDGTFECLNGGERIADLNYWSNYMQYLLPVTRNAPEIDEKTATISGYVWSDSNADQVIEWSEYSYHPLEGWTVMLTNKYGSRVATTKTDLHGYYYFRGLKPGTYKVWVQDVRFFNQVAPYYKFCTWPPWGYNKGHYTIYAQAASRYRLNNFGMLDMRDSVWAPLYYALWWIGLLQYQFTW